MMRYEEDLWRKASRAATLLQLAPFVHFVAVTGSLGRGEAKPDSDADLFVVTESHHLYTARAFALTILKLAGQRINVEGGRIGGTVDPNYWLTSDHLDIAPHNAYVARDYTYMVPLWDQRGIYQTIVRQNQWTEEYKRQFRSVHPPRSSIVLRGIQILAERICLFFGDRLERWARTKQEQRVRSFAERQGQAEKVICSDSELRLHL